MLEALQIGGFISAEHPEVNSSKVPQLKDNPGLKWHNFKTAKGHLALVNEL